MAENTNPQERRIVTRKEAKAAGAKRYFTGKPCKAGHLAERFAIDGRCRDCNTSRQAVARAPRTAVSMAKIAADRASYVEALETGATRYFTGRACKYGHIAERFTSCRKCVICAYSQIATVRAGNPEIGRAQAAAWRAANLDKVRVAMKAYQISHPEVMRAVSATRRARKRQANGKHTGADIIALFKLQRGKCAHSWCRKNLSRGHHVDHILPLSIGGSNGRLNLQLLCPPCNLHKHNTHPIDYAQRHGMLL